MGRIGGTGTERARRAARRAGPVLLAMLAAGAALAQAVPTQVQRTGGVEVTLHLHGFLSAEERQFLELVAASPEALEVMLGGAGAAGHAAMAAAPGEGLLQGGMPAPSAHAVAQLPDAAAARAEALRGCEAARGSGPACVVVLEAAPRR